MADLFFFYVLLCAAGAVLGQFQLEPMNSMALQGSDVSFNATVNDAWQVMTWHVRDLLVLNIQQSGEVTSSSEQFSAKFCSGSDASCVAFTIHNVSRSDSGPVTCTVLGAFGSQTAQLVVQESGSVNIVGGNVTATQDQQVEFQCVAAAWFPIPTVSWRLDSQLVNGSNSSSVAHGDAFNFTSVLKFQAVRSTRVECLATISTLTSPQSSTVYLAVVPKPTDWTVLIAVVVSIGGFALLVLLIIGIIFCCKLRKEKQLSYQEEMSRRVRTQSQTSGVRPPGQKRGRVNMGCVMDGEMSVAPSEADDSGFSQASGSQIFKIPEPADSNQGANGYSNANSPIDGFTKHRHVTIV